MRICYLGPVEGRLSSMRLLVIECFSLQEAIACVEEELARRGDRPRESLELRPGALRHNWLATVVYKECSAWSAH